MSGHDRIDWQQAPEDASAWAVDSKGDAWWLHWDAERDHFDDGGWLQPGMTNSVQTSMTPADIFGWDSARDWHDSLTFRPW